MLHEGGTAVSFMVSNFKNTISLCNSTRKKSLTTNPSCYSLVEDPLTSLVLDEKRKVLRIFPNLFAKETELNAESTFEYFIYDLLGNLVGKGEDRVELGNALLSGSYIVRIKGPEVIER